MSYTVPTLPLDIETDLFMDTDILRKLVDAKSALSELKASGKLIPNERILLDTLALREAKISSEIENIVTTQDDLYINTQDVLKYTNLHAKEVHTYVRCLLQGYSKIKRNGFLANKDIIHMFQNITGIDDRFRRTPVYLKDPQGHIVYTPPEIHADIKNMMANLEKYINENSLSPLDPLIKMAIIHHQFETIHPFQDGNGRCGRIINVLYLILQGLLDHPTLYLSYYINTHKHQYYDLLQLLRHSPPIATHWKQWILFILQGIKETSKENIVLITDIKDLMQKTKHIVRTQQPKIYSQDLINVLFYHPYTKISYVQQTLGVSRPTATKYLKILTSLGIVQNRQIGRETYYINKNLTPKLATKN